MKYRLNPSQKEPVMSAIGRHFESGHPEVAFVYLFGSFAKEESFADVDLGIGLFTEVGSALEEELSHETNLETVVQYPLDVRILNGAPNAFVYNVIKNGKLIVDRDPDYRADFCGQVLKAYFDFAYFRRRYLKDVANARLKTF